MIVVVIAAKAVLSGADFSLLQTGRVQARRVESCMRMTMTFELIRAD